MSVIDIELFKRKIIAKADEEWVNNVNNKPKLRLYTTFKNIRKAEDYVTSGFPRYNRSLMAQLRSGTLPLAIEVGRYRGLAVEDRICTVCNLNITESELHFILECPAYTRSSMDDILLQYDTINQWRRSAPKSGGAKFFPSLWVMTFFCVAIFCLVF